MTEIEPVDWRARLEAAVAETLRVRAARAAVRRELDARRQVGLARRQAEKLGLASPECCAGLEEPCPQHVQAARVVRHQGPRSRSGGATAVIGESGRAKPVRNLPEENR